MLQALIAACFLALTMTAAAQFPRAPEYQVKVAFLYNLAKFVEWPAAPSPGSKPNSAHSKTSP